LKFKKEDRWANYLKGAAKYVINRDIPQHGYNFTIASQIPQSVGLASSTALTSASAFAIKAFHGLAIPDEEMIKIVLDAETEFGGMTPSIANAYTVYQSRAHSALFTDLKSDTSEYYPFEPGEYKIVLTDSKVRQAYADSEIEARISDEKKFMQSVFGSSAKTMRTVSLSDIDEAMGTIPESWRRRSLHVVEEMQRVKEGCDLLARGDSLSFGRLLSKSQQGLRNLYEVSCPEVDWLVKRALEIEGVAGTRLVGKGFGGCTISLMTDSALEEYKKRIEEYERIFGFKASVCTVEAVSGVRVLV
jgi:galactokinase